MLRHPLPPKAPTNTDASRSIQNSKWEATSLIPSAPPTPVTAIGYPVQVIGKVSRFYDTRQIVVESIGKCCVTYLSLQTERVPMTALHKPNMGMNLKNPASRLMTNGNTGKQLRSFTSQDIPCRNRLRYQRLLLFLHVRLVRKSLETGMKGDSQLRHPRRHRGRVSPRPAHP